MKVLRSHRRGLFRGTPFQQGGFDHDFRCPAVAGTRGMNASWEGKDRRAARDRQGEAYCVNWQAALCSHSSWSDRVRAPTPARGAPFTIYRRTIVASTTMRSATPRFMGTAGGADPTFSSHPAGIVGRARRVRLPAIEGLRGKGVLPASGHSTFAHCRGLGRPRSLNSALPPRAGYRFVTSSPEK